MQIVVLTLKDSPRLDALLAELERVNILAHCQIVENERDEEDGIRGCFLAHQNALLNAMDDHPEARAIAVFEDDVVFNLRGAWASVREAMLAAAAAVNELEIECVGLGGMPVLPYQSASTDRKIFKTSFQLAHAYVVSIEAARKMGALEYVRHGRMLRLFDHWDQQMAKTLTQGIVYPSVAFQCASVDVTTTNTEKAGVAVMRARDALSQQRLQIGAERTALCVGAVMRMLCCTCCLRPRLLRKQRLRAYANLPVPPSVEETHSRSTVGKA